MRRIVKKLLHANKQQIMEDYGVDFEQFNPRILLSYSDVVNAFTIPNLDKHPVIVVHRGLIREAQSEDESIVPSWDPAVRLALKEYSQQGTSYIASALYAAGITQDPRINKLKATLRYQDYIDETGKSERDALTTNDEGQIINPYAVPRIRQEIVLLQKINWQELREPPLGLGFAEFSQKYHRFLKANSNAQSIEQMTEYAFVDEFLRQLVNLPPEEIQAIKMNKDLFSLIQ